MCDWLINTTALNFSSGSGGGGSPHKLWTVFCPLPRLNSHSCIIYMGWVWAVPIDQKCSSRSETFVPHPWFHPCQPYVSAELNCWEIFDRPYLLFLLFLLFLATSAWGLSELWGVDIPTSDIIHYTPRLCCLVLHFNLVLTTHLFLL